MFVVSALALKRLLRANVAIFTFVYIVWFIIAYLLNYESVRSSCLISSVERFLTSCNKAAIS